MCTFKQICSLKLYSKYIEFYSTSFYEDLQKLTTCTFKHNFKVLVGYQHYFICYTSLKV